MCKGWHQWPSASQLPLFASRLLTAGLPANSSNLLLASGPPPHLTRPAHSSHHPPPRLGILQVALSSDEEVFGGWQNVTKNSNVTFQTQSGDYDNRPNSIQVLHLGRLPGSSKCGGQRCSCRGQGCHVERDGTVLRQCRPL